MTNLRDLIKEKSVAILDGGLGSVLSSKGFSDPLLFSSRFILDNPNEIISCHKEYINSGADIVISSSYQASFEGFSKIYPNLSYEDFLSKVCNESVKLAKIARDETSNNTLIAASIGSYGAHLADGSEFYGNFGKTVKELSDWHYDKVNSMYSFSTADVIACETIPCIDEIKAFIHIFNDLLIDSDSNKPTSAWVSMSCKSSTELNSSESIEDAIRAIEDPNLYYSSNKLSSKLDIGVNCTSPLYIKDIVIQLKEFSSKNREIIAYPNKGEEWLADQHDWKAHSAVCNDEEFANLAYEWHECGANVIGGCCRTTPNTILQIKNKFKKY